MSKQRKEVSQVPSEGSLELTEEIIRKRAYQLFEERGYEHGHDIDDWFQAEAEVTGKKNAPRTDLNTTIHETAAA